MALIHCGMALLAASSALVSPHVPTKQVVRSHPAPAYTAGQMEAYLSAQDVAYIRPGFKIKNFTLSNVGPGKKPLVEVWYVDDMDQPLDYLGKATPGPLSISFILAWYDGPARQYTSYTTRVTGGIRIPSSDQGGTWNHIELGHSKYTFGTTLPADFKMDKTTTLSIYGRRDVRQWLDKYYYLDNTNYDFRADGAAVTETWAAMDVAACNQCHDPLALHGGTRRTTKNCVLCHQPQVPIIDGENFDFKVFIHKLHAETTYPQDLRNCTTCHQASAAEGYIWYTNPSRKACGSCHDDIDFAAGEGHIPQADDSACASCHIPQGEYEFDISIKGAHTIPTKSAQLEGLKLTILSVTHTAPGQAPTVTYTLKNNEGTDVDPKTLNRFRFLMGGPTTEYMQAGYLREDAGAKSTCSSGTCSYTFTGVIPADATGSFTMSADYYRNVTIDNHTETGLSVREAGQNPIFHFPVTDSQAVARRAVVEIDKCNKCHNVLGAHGGQRFLVAECDMCHTPDLTEDGESFHMKWMVHRLHTGEELTRPYVGFEEILYPGDRRNCEACHVAGSYGVPLPEGTLPTDTPNDFAPSWPPASAACLSCHDTIDAAAHAYVNNAPFGEACAACHGAGRDFAVSKVHAR
jgi:OmcA/MtrC family decaheme c-type cytochrome